MEFKGSGYQKTIATISAMQAFKILRKGCQGYLCAIEMTEQKELDLTEIPVVIEFPNEVPGFPPNRQIEFTMDLPSGIAPISKTPYRMALVKLTKLKTGVQELLDKGLIQPSASP